MGSTVDAGENGFNYDFGIMISKGTVGALTATVAAATALSGVIYALSSATNELDATIYNNQVAFGGYANTLKAIHYASDQLASGKTIFETADVIKGMRSIQAAGLDVKKNFDLINSAAAATGNSFAGMSHAIEKGDFGSLAEAGIISNRMAQSLDAVGYNAQTASRKVMQLLEEANKKGIFDNTIKTFPAILARFHEFHHRFVHAMIGDPKDPNGLAFQMKETFSSVADWFYSNLHKIEKVGAVIGSTLKFVFNVASDMAKRIWNNIHSIFASSDKFFGHFEDKMMSFQLWLEIARVKIGAFFDEYGDRIKTILKIVAIGMLIRELDIYAGKAMTTIKSLSAAYKAGEPLMRGFFSETGLLNQLKIGQRIEWMFLKGIGPSIQYATKASWGFVQSLLANPMTWVVVAIAALVAMVVYWDQIRAYASSFSDTTLLILSFLAPMVGVVLLIAKYWNEISAILQNVWAILVNIGNYVWNNIVSFFVELGSAIKNTVLSELKAMKDTYLAPIVTIFESIWNFVSKIVDAIPNINIGSWLDKAVNLLGKGAEATAKMAEDSGKLKGASATVGRKAITTQQQVEKDAKRMVAKGASVEEIAATQGRTTGQTAKTLKAISAPSTQMQQITHGGTTIASGAVQINLGTGSNINEDILAKKVQKILEDFAKKGKLRDGSVN